MKHYTLTILLLIVTTPTIAQIPDQPSVDFEIYYGYEWGAAGIASALISSTTIIPPPVNLNASIQKAIDYIIQNRFRFQGNDYFAWEKGPKLQTGIYPGIKYGAAGIILTLTDAYQYSKNDSYLDLAKTTMQELMNQAVDNLTLPHWGYSYGTPSSGDGIALTGINFGATGVIKAALALYKTTKDTSYLQIAQKIFNWIHSVSQTKGNDIISVPWYTHVPGFLSVEIYEYARGMAGIAPTLMELGILAQNTTIQEFARKLGNYLVQTQLDDGSWTIQNDTDISTPFLGTGTAGIILGLHETQKLAQQNWYDQAIQAGIKNLIAQLKQGIISIDDKMAHNSLYEGTLGVFHALFLLEEHLSDEQDQTVNEQFQAFLNSQIVIATDAQQQLLFLKLDPETASRFDLSLGNGLAGLVSSLSQIKKNPEITINEKTYPVLQTAVQTLISLQNPNGSWNRQVTTSLPIISNTPAKTSPLPFLVMTIAILILSRKKISNTK